MKVLSVTQGFITNSSSAVHAFDNELLEVPEIKAFLQKFGIVGYVGSDLWGRGGGEESILLTDAQKKETLSHISSYAEKSPPIPQDPTKFVVVFTDEGESLARDFCEFITDYLKRTKQGGGHTYLEYN